MAGNKDPVYNKFKRDFSQFYTGKLAYKKLKCCLCDHLPISVIADPNNVALTLINLLEKKNLISYNNVSLLWEIAVLTEVFDAKQCVVLYMKAKSLHNPEVDGLTQEEKEKGLREYRKILYEAIEQVGPNELPTVKAFYQCDGDDLWEVVLALEYQTLLNTREKLKTFASNLNAVAKGIIVDGLEMLIPKEEEEVAKLVKEDQGMKAPLTTSNSLINLSSLVILFVPWMLKQFGIYTHPSQFIIAVSVGVASFIALVVYINFTRISLFFKSLSITNKIMLIFLLFGIIVISCYTFPITTIFSYFASLSEKGQIALIFFILIIIFTLLRRLDVTITYFKVVFDLIVHIFIRDSAP